MKNSVKTAILATAVATASLGPNITQIFAADTGGAVEDAQKTLDQSNQTLESAKTTLDSANQAYQSAQADVNRLTSEKSEADTKLSDAKTQLEQAQNEYDGLKEKADSITEEDITNAQQALTDATNAADAAQAEADKASKALDDANAIYNDASTQLTNAQNAYNQALEAQAAAQQALDAAKAEQAKAEEDARQAESDKNTAEDNAKSAEENAKSVEEANPDAEKKAQEAKDAADKADAAQTDAQKDVDDASKAKDTAESEKNSAEENAKSASDDVTSADKEVSDITADVNNSETEHKNSQAYLDEADRTLADETAKAGDAQAKADQEVKDQQAFVDQKTAEKEDADKALEDAKSVQAEKQKALDEVNAKLDEAKDDQADAEKELKNKQDALDAAKKTLANAKGNVTAKKQAVTDAENAVKDAQDKVKQSEERVHELETDADAFEQELTDAKKAVKDAEDTRDKAEKALTDARAIHKIIYAQDTDAPLVDGTTNVYHAYIPEAGNHKITYLCNDDDIKRELNKYGTVTARTEKSYTYSRGNYAVTSPIPLEGETPLYVNTVTANRGTHHIVATWKDDNNQDQRTDIYLTINSNGQNIANVNYDNNRKKALDSMNLDGKTWAEKAQAITDYVAYNFRYDWRNQSGDMFDIGGGDCWASTNLICDLARDAGFAATPRNDNFEGGTGHRNAVLQDPDGNVYLCEAGFDREVHEMEHGIVTQAGTKDQVSWQAQPYQLYGYMDDAKTKVGRAGWGTDPHVIGFFNTFNNTELQVPTDPSVTALGFDTETVANDVNNDPNAYSKVTKDANGKWMVDAQVGGDGMFEHQNYYDPFILCRNLETVKVGKNITKIATSAFKGTYWDETRDIKFVIDPDNPVYASTEDGGVVLKVDNDQGKAGDKIYTPTKVETDSEKETPTDVSDSDRTANIAKANEAYTSALKTYTDAKTKYDKLNSAGGSAQAIANAKAELNTAETALKNAEDNKKLADNALTNANTIVTDSEKAQAAAENALQSAQSKLDDAKKAVAKAQAPVDNAKKSLDDAKAVVSEKQGAVDKAQSAVDEAKKTLDDKKKAAEQGAPESLINARKAVEKAQTDLKTKEKALTDANKALDNAKKTLSDKKEALDKANETLEDKKKALTKAENTLSEKNDALAKAKEDSQKAHDDLDKANTAYQSVTDAKAKSDDAATALKDAQEKLDKANKTLADAKADVENKSKELDSANEKAKDLLEQLGLAQSDADTKKISADDAKKLYDEKSAALYEGKATEANAKAALDDLVNTLNRRDELEKEINDLNESIPDYEKDAEALGAQLDTAKATASTAETVYNSAKQTYDAIVAAESKTITYAAAEISVNADGTMSFRSNADLTKFKGVQVDGKDVDPSQYTLSKGSTVVNLKKSFVDSLGKGNHTITIISEDGSASTSFELNDKGASVVNNNTAKTSESAKTTSNSTQAYVTSTPDTGDEENTAVWIFLEAVALLGAGGALYIRRRKHAE